MAGGRNWRLVDYCDVAAGATARLGAPGRDGEQCGAQGGGGAGGGEAADDCGDRRVHGRERVSGRGGGRGEAAGGGHGGDVTAAARGVYSCQ